jgi:hypothetical protein
MPKLSFLAAAIAVIAFAGFNSAIAQTAQGASTQKPQREAVLAAVQKHASGVRAHPMSKQATIAQARAKHSARLVTAHHPAAKVRVGAAAKSKTLQKLPRAASLKSSSKRLAALPHAHSSAAQHSFKHIPRTKQSKRA